MSEVEIGRGKRARRAYTLDDVAVVASRRTRDVQEVQTTWQLDAYHLDIPILSAPMDSVTSPATAIALGKLGGLGVLDLEGLWTRYEDPEPFFEEIAHLDKEDATPRLQEIYAEPIKVELLRERLREIRDAGVTVAGALSPGGTQQMWRAVVDAGVDIFVIRGTTVSADRTWCGSGPRTAEFTPSSVRADRPGAAVRSDVTGDTRFGTRQQGRTMGQQGIWVLGGYQSDFARNLSREGIEVEIGRASCRERVSFLV